jgi:hypothetical protein
MSVDVGFLFYVVIGQVGNSEAVAPSADLMNRDGCRLVHEGYVVARMSPAGKETFQDIMAKMVKKVKFVTSVFNKKEIEDAEVDMRPETGRSSTDATGHLSEADTKAMVEIVKQALVDSGVPAERLQGLTAHSETTALLKTHQGYHEDQMLHVDSIQANIHLMGSGNNFETLEAEFWRGPFTVIVPMHRRQLSVIPGGHRGWIWRTNRDDEPRDALQRDSPKEVNEEVAGIFARTDLTLYEMWEKQYQLMAANYTYNGDLFLKELGMEVKDLYFATQAMPHRGKGNFTKSVSITMLFFVFQREGTPLVLHPKTVLVTECMTEGKIVRCSFRCASCESNIMFSDMWLVEGTEHCPSCYKKLGLDGGVRKEYAPTSERVFMQAFEGAKRLVTRAAAGWNGGTVGEFGEKLVSYAGDATRFECDLASMMSYTSKVHFRRRVKRSGSWQSYCTQGPIIARLILEFMASEGDRLANDRGNWGSWRQVIRNVMQRTGQSWAIRRNETEAEAEAE